MPTVSFGLTGSGHAAPAGDRDGSAPGRAGRRKLMLEPNSEPVLSPAPYLSGNRSSSAVLSSVLIAGPVEGGCGGEERDVVRAGAQPYLGARAAWARRHDG